MASDNFASASDPLASPWASWGSFATLRAVSGGCRNSAGSDGDAGMRYGSSSETSSQCDYVSGVTDGGPGLHMDSSGNGYISTAYDTNIHCFRLNAGSYTELGSPPIGAYSAGQPTKIRRSGNALVISVAGSDVFTTPNDTTFTGGNPGIFSYAGDLIQDNWTDGASGTAYTLALAQGSYALGGQAVVLRAARRMPAAQGSYSLTGQGVTLRMTRGVLAVAQGAYALNGQSVTLTGPLVGYSLSLTQGSYNLVGSDAAVDSVISLAPGAYALTGNPVVLKYGHKLPAAQGSYALNGQPLTIRVTRAMSAAQGSYAVNGQVVTLTQHSPAPRLTVESGSYSITGNQVGLISSAQGGGNIFHAIPLNWWTKGL